MIEVTSDASKLTARYRQRMQQMGRAVLRAENENAAERKRWAVILSSGSTSTKMLRDLRKFNKGRGPYSRLSPMPPSPPYIINKQSTGFGSISQMWQTRLTSRPDGTIVTLYNTSPHAGMAFGTMYAIPRPILQAVNTATHDKCLRRLALLKSKALR